MANYLVDTMVWSYSRLNTFAQCPYQFFLKYLEQVEESKMFFASFGSLVHSILAGYYSGVVSAMDALTDYLVRFSAETRGASPPVDIRYGFFRQGVEAMKSLSPIAGHILGIEKRVSFDVEGYPFIGFVDMVYEDSDSRLCILDHKSRLLKPRSTRKKPTKTDAELDEYLRQLYLYAIPVANKYGRYPDFLEFNCYRSGLRIREPFVEDALETTKQWATSTIDAIRNETDWRPNLDFWRCKYLCGFCDQCEYAQSVDWR